MLGRCWKWYWRGCGGIGIADGWQREGVTLLTRRLGEIGFATWKWEGLAQLTWQWEAGIADLAMRWTDIADLAVGGVGMLTWH